jgi:phospholipase/lecithinase/hemolysin
MLADHVHPSIRGHQLIAEEVLGAMIAEGWIGLTGDGPGGYEQAWDEHLRSLDSLYFEVGRRRLEDLRRWTRGESALVKPATPGEKTRRASGGSG